METIRLGGPTWRSRASAWHVAVRRGMGRDRPRGGDRDGRARARAGHQLLRHRQGVRVGRVGAVCSREALRGGPREQVVIATKGGLRQRGRASCCATRARRGCAKAWRRACATLGTDYVDIYQVHWPDPATPFAETGGGAGGVRGGGQGAPRRSLELRRAADRGVRAHAATLETLQPPYHMLRREIEDAILPYCREHDIGVLVVRPARARPAERSASRADSQLTKDDWRAGSDLFSGENFQRNLEIVERLRSAGGGARDHAWLSWRSRGRSRTRRCTWRSSARGGRRTSRAWRRRRRCDSTREALAQRGGDPRAGGDGRRALPGGRLR